MTTYANQMTVTLSRSEAILHFCFISPNYDKNGNVLEEPSISDEQTIVMSVDAFQEFKRLITGISTDPKE